MMLFDFSVPVLNNKRKLCGMNQSGLAEPPAEGKLHREKEFCYSLPVHRPHGCRSRFRWIKFEEKVEEGGERWSKPHVSTLSLHSLFELRTCLQTGTVLLDLDGYSLPQIIGRSWRVPVVSGGFFPMS